MSNLKRFLAMTLVMFMMIGAFAMTVSAKTFEDIDPKDTALVAAVDLLSSLGIARGYPNGDFGPEDDVLREQFAMFVARIHTGTPEYFEVPATRDVDQTVFADVNGKDPLWYLPINYCYESNIITGEVAPSDNASQDGTFGLGKTIIFQDAVTMLVRSLGYDKTGLSYPVGFLAKAREIGLLDGFNGALLAMKAQDTVTRADMAMLLYNYFMADFYDVNLVWNQTSAQHVERVSYKPVSEKFGITKIEGYVTAIEGAALPMAVENPYAPFGTGTAEPIDNRWIWIDQEAYPISIRNANETLSGHHDIIISWVAPETYAVTSRWEEYDWGWSTGYRQVTESGGQKIGHLRTTKANLGLAEDYAGLAGSRELLGLKVLAFVDSQNRIGVKLPATQVIGTKHKVEKAEVVGNPMEDRGTHVHERLIREFKFTDTDGTLHSFNQYNERHFTNDYSRQQEGDVNRHTGYVFASDNNGRAWTLDDSYKGASKIHAGHGEYVNSIWYLASIIKSGNFDLGAMDIDVIDNGMNKDGTKNRTVIFTPYEAGVFDHHDPDAFWAITKGDGYTYTNFRRNDTNINRFVDAANFDNAKNPDRHGAYYFSLQGEYIVVGNKLVEITNREHPAQVIDTNSTTATFTLNVAMSNATWAGAYGNVRIDYSNDGVFFRALNNRKNFGTPASYMNANAYPILIGESYRIFAAAAPSNPVYGFFGENHGAFMAIKTSGAPTQPGPYYGMILNYGGIVNINGASRYAYKVWNINLGRTDTIYVNTGPTLSQYASGTYIKYRNESANTHEVLGAVNSISNPPVLFSTPNVFNAPKAFAAPMTQAQLESILVNIAKYVIQGIDSNYNPTVNVLDPDFWYALISTKKCDEEKHGSDEEDCVCVIEVKNLNTQLAYNSIIATVIGIVESLDSLNQGAAGIDAKYDAIAPLKKAEADAKKLYDDALKSGKGNIDSLNPETTESTALLVLRQFPTIFTNLATDIVSHGLPTGIDVQFTALKTLRLGAGSGSASMNTIPSIETKLSELTSTATSNATSIALMVTAAGATPATLPAIIALIEQALEDIITATGMFTKVFDSIKSIRTDFNNMRTAATTERTTAITNGLPTTVPDEIILRTGLIIEALDTIIGTYTSNELKNIPLISKVKADDLALYSLTNDQVNYYKDAYETAVKATETAVKAYADAIKAAEALVKFINSETAKLNTAIKGFETHAALEGASGATILNFLQTIVKEVGNYNAIVVKYATDILKNHEVELPPVVPGPGPGPGDIVEPTGNRELSHYNTKMIDLNQYGAIAWDYVNGIYDADKGMKLNEVFSLDGTTITINPTARLTMNTHIFIYDSNNTDREQSLNSIRLDDFQRLIVEINKAPVPRACINSAMFIANNASGLFTIGEAQVLWVGVKYNALAATGQSVFDWLVSKPYNANEAKTPSGTGYYYLNESTTSTNTFTGNDGVHYYRSVARNAIDGTTISVAIPVVHGMKYVDMPVYVSSATIMDGGTQRWVTYEQNNVYTTNLTDAYIKSIINQGNVYRFTAAPVYNAPVTSITTASGVTYTNTGSIRVIEVRLNTALTAYRKVNSYSATGVSTAIASTVGDAASLVYDEINASALSTFLGSSGNYYVIPAWDNVGYVDGFAIIKVLP